MQYYLVQVKLKQILMTGSVYGLCVLLSGCIGFSSNKSAPFTSDTGIYTVAYGDSLNIIARKIGMSVDELSRMNRIKNVNHIRPGQVLKIKQTGAWYASESKKAKKVRSNQVDEVIVSSQESWSPNQKAKVEKKIQQAQVRDSGTKSASAAQINWKRPTQGAIVKTYHPSLPGRKGIQYAGSVGQNIVAAAKGQVVHAGSAPGGYGQLIILKHSNTVYSTYGYLSEVLVKEGDQVNLGQSIAKMGMSSDKRAVLNFEIRVGRNTSNPSLYIR